MYQIELPEVVDIYDDLGKPIGVKPRRQVHRDGDWHFTFHCLVVSGSADSLSFVLQRRSRYVDEYPGLIDVTVGGHLHAGERMADGVRELREELGLDVAFGSLDPLGRYPIIVRGGGVWIREWSEIFVLHDDRPPTDFAFDPNEVGSLVTIPVSSARALCRGEIEVTSAVESVAGTAVQRIVRASDFVNDVPGYWHYVSDAVLERYGRCLPKG
jgi:8-oxo-dGTP pyrophosphatase MutT (NUDIX family)